MRKEKSCGAVIMRYQEGVYSTLLVKHTQGHWGFPKGHKEEGETEQETAIRETLEETGLTVTLDSGFCDSSTYWPQPDVYKKVIYFLGKVESGNEQPDYHEIEEVKWFRVSEAMAALSYPSDVAILENALKYIHRMVDDD